MFSWLLLPGGPEKKSAAPKAKLTHDDMLYLHERRKAAELRRRLHQDIPFGRPF